MEDIICESVGNQEEICLVASGKIVSVTIKKQLSIAPCIKESSWFFEADKIRVTNGCRAEFTLEIEKSECSTGSTCTQEPAPAPAPTPAPTSNSKEGVVAVDGNGQPTINGLASRFSCTPSIHAECTKFCTVIVDGVEAGRYIGDTNGSDYDLPTFRFTKRGDQYCGGPGGTCTVQIACRNKKHNLFVTFPNPGAPASGPSDPWTKHTYNTKGWQSGGLSYGFWWASVGNDGRMAIMLGGHLQKDAE